MSKKPKVMTTDAVAAALEAVIGKNDEEATVRQFLDTGFPPLNFAASSRFDGGLPVGRMIEIAGPPSAGKTAISTAAMVAAQKMGGIAGFNDHERSFSFSLAEGLGLNTKPGTFVYRKPKTFEESVAIFQLSVETIRKAELIPEDAPICWVFDSLAAMVPQSILVDSKGKDRAATDRNMNDNTALARATSAHFPAIAMLAEEHNVCCIFLNQLRTKIGVLYGDPRKTSGGDAPAFYFSQRLWLSASKIDKGTGATKEVIGTEVTGQFVKNKVSRPFLKANWNFMFREDGSGFFDREGSLVEFLASEGILPAGTVKGSVIWDGKQYPKSVLTEAIRKSGAIDRLVALLPSNYEPPVVAEIDVDPDADAEGSATEAA